MRFIKNRVYADAASTTPLSKNVKDELLRLIPIYGNPGSLHKEGVDARHELTLARSRIAHSLKVDPSEIIFTSGGTEANNLAIMGTLQQAVASGIHTTAVTSGIEHVSILEPLRHLSQKGLQIAEVSVTEEGLVDLKELVAAIDDSTMLVSIHFLNNELGTIQPIQAIAKEIKEIKKNRIERSISKALYFHVDASQAPFWIQLDLSHIEIDLMTLDAHKIGGPKGVGCLVVRKTVQISPILYGGGQEKGIRSTTENVLLIGAFAVAFVDSQIEIDKRVAHMVSVRNYLCNTILSNIEGATLYGPVEANRSPNSLTLSIDGLDAEVAVLAMDKGGVSISNRSTCTQSEKDPSHVLQAIGLSEDRIQNALRITLLPYATYNDANTLFRVLKKVAARYRIIA